MAKDRNATHEPIAGIVARGRHSATHIALRTDITDLSALAVIGKREGDKRLRSQQVCVGNCRTIVNQVRVVAVLDQDCEGGGGAMRESR